MELLLRQATAFNAKRGTIVLPVSVFCAMATPPMTVNAKPVVGVSPTKPISTLAIHGYIVLPASSFSLAVIAHTIEFVLNGLIVLLVSVFHSMVMPPMTVYAKLVLEDLPTKPISTLVIHGLIVLPASIFLSMAQPLTIGNAPTAPRRHTPPATTNRAAPIGPSVMPTNTSRPMVRPPPIGSAQQWGY